MTTLCKDIPRTHFDGTTSVKRKDSAETALAAANRWLQEQANGWCDLGVCSVGKCNGVLSNVRVKVVSETADSCEIEFSADIACECPAVQPPPTPAQVQAAVASKLAILTHYNELIAIPVPEPELSAFRTMREGMKQWLLAEIATLTTTPAEADEFWKKVCDFAVAAGLGYIIEKIIGGVAGKALGPVVHILGDPTPIGGVDIETVDTLVVRNPPHCYKITWYRTRWSDELLWGPVRIKIERIPCD